MLRPYQPPRLTHRHDEGRIPVEVRSRVKELILAVLIVSVLPACTTTVNAPASEGSSPSPSPVRPSIARISDQQAKWMTGRSWHAGCPVPIAALRVVTVAYRDFEGEVAQGRLIVNRRVAPEVLSVFTQLFDAGFPIAHMDPTSIDPPGALAGPVHDDTEGFACVRIPGTRVWSQHAYGLAIDVNPVQNPWVKDGRVLPRAGRRYVDRTQAVPGMIHPGDAVTRAFAGIGWGWGGDWHSFKDYMHFSASGG